MARNLTNRQQKVLRIILAFLDRHDSPPTITEIQKAMRLRSSFGVRRHLEALEKKGYIRRRGGKARGIELIRPAWMIQTHLPIVGRIVAGVPLLTEEEPPEMFPVPGATQQGQFLLRVTGKSMEPTLHEGDLALVTQESEIRSGQIAVMEVDGEVTVKRFHREASGIRLQPDNRAFETITVPPTSQFRLIGRVIGLWRKF